ncbi:transporter substrate-binding domain-containing protein [Brenneria populi subsp. brevivirga]|uniref:transporter substrate-binding domain-containing protein n=1 Tax=Brenneria populi TaxID=1505588 RepID=UPI002E1811E5|nr:transporter substrate-binding domain-containing protein [Brenneria populi subsp. brevivirga]
MIIDEIRERGFLRAGVSLGFHGFSCLNPITEQWEGFDIELARAVSAAVLGNENSIEFIPLSSSELFEALQNNRIDIRTYNASITLSREITDKVYFTCPMLYDGEGLLARKSEKDEKTSTWENLLFRCPHIAALKGSTSHENLIHFFHSRNLKFAIHLYKSPKDARQSYDDRECDIFCLDRYLLTGAQTVLKEPYNHEILPYVIYREAMAPFVKDSDSQWRSVTTWIMRTLIEEESLGIESHNIDNFGQDTKNHEYRFLNPPEFILKYLRLENHYVRSVIKSVGNYGEVFDRVLRVNSGINTPRRENRP